VGRDDNASLGPKETGARAALPIWIDVMEASLAGSPPVYFDIPDGTIQVTMDPDTGKRLPRDDPRAVRALFRQGQEP
jgi:penicillin-binding protein 1A